MGAKMGAKMGANILGLIYLQTYIICFDFAIVHIGLTVFTGVCGALRHEKTHTVGDVGLVVW